MWMSKKSKVPRTPRFNHSGLLTNPEPLAWERSFSFNRVPNRPFSSSLAIWPITPEVHSINYQYLVHYYSNARKL